jgi:phage FluMu protein Com
MNIRCAFCQMPYTLSRVDMLDALQEMDAHKLTHYDAHCPRCRRATQIPRQRIEMFMPNWREELKAFEVEMKEHPQHAAPLPEAEAVAEGRQGPDAAPIAAAPPEGKSAPKAKPAEKKPAAKPALKKTPAAATASKGKKTTKKSR